MTDKNERNEKRSFTKTLTCPHCDKLLTIKFDYYIELDQLDVYRIIGM